MKIISKKAGNLSNIERYDLCDVFSESETVDGLIICYALATCKDSKFISLDMRAKHEEIGVTEQWRKRYTANSFESTFVSVENFTNTFDTDDFGLWTITILYQNTEVVVSGEKEKTEIGVSYPKEKKVNLLPLLSGVETNTYSYNQYDKKILSLLKADFRMTEKRAVLTMKKLQAYQDIYDEFVLVATTKKYVSKDRAIVIEGFTAEKLNSDFPLSVIGACNFLIYLRESPKEALEDLRKGLPRK